MDAFDQIERFERGMILAYGLRGRRIKKLRTCRMDGGIMKGWTATRDNASLMA